MSEALQQRPRIFVGHACTQKGCTTLAFYLVTGVDGPTWYCLQHAAQYREIMAALGTTVHIELVTEELDTRAPAAETTVESWTCINCLAHGDLELPSTTTIAEVRQRIFEAHHASSPACEAIDMRWRLYDRRVVMTR
jgi:hypothetical protein